MFHRMYGGLLGICVLALLVSAVVVLGGNIVSGISGTSTEPAAAMVGSRASLTFLPEQLVPSERTLHGFVSLSLPAGLIQNLVDDSRGSHVTSCPVGSRLVHAPYAPQFTYCTVVRCYGARITANENYCSVIPAYADRTLVLHVIESDPHGDLTFDTATEVPLSEVFDYKYTPGTHIPIDIPVLGDQRAFPQDHYSAFLSIGMLIPGVHDLTDPKWPTYAHQFNPVYQYGRQYTLAGGEQIATSPRCIARGTDRCYIAGHTITVSRGLAEILYIYVVAVTPLVFALLFVHLLFFNPRYKHEPIQEFMAALVAAILAILPLRVILVPAEIGGLTRVDILLGVGLVAIVSAVVIKYVLEIWRQDRGAVQDREEERRDPLDVTPPADVALADG